MNKKNLLEFKRFIKKYWKMLIISGSILAVTFSLFTFFIVNKSSSSKDEIEEVSQSDYFENDSMPAYFQFYLERLDGTVFSNAAMVERFLNTESRYQQTLEHNGIKLMEIKEIVRGEEGKEDYVPIDIRTDDASYIYTAIIETGNDKDNLKIANFFYEYL